MTFLGIIVVGTVAGLMSSTLGIGGGIIIVPALSIVFGFSQQEAIATSLAAIFTITAMNVIRFQRQGLILWKIALPIALFSLISSFLAGLTAVHLPEKTLILIFLIFILFLTYKTIFLKNKVTAEKKSINKLQFASFKIGTLSGLISGITGVGGGVIITPLALTNRLCDNLRVVPCSNTVMLFTTFFGALAFIINQPANLEMLQFGFVRFDAALIIFLSALPATWFGTRYQSKMPLNIRKYFLAAFLILIAVSLTIKITA